MSKVIGDPELGEAPEQQVFVEPPELKERLDIEEGRETDSVTAEQASAWPVSHLKSIGGKYWQVQSRASGSRPPPAGS